MWDRRAQGGWDGLDQLAGRDNTFDAVEGAVADVVETGVA